MSGLTGWVRRVGPVVELCVESLTPAQPYVSGSELTICTLPETIPLPKLYRRLLTDRDGFGRHEATLRVNGDRTVTFTFDQTFSSTTSVNLAGVWLAA